MTIALVIALSGNQDSGAAGVPSPLADSRAQAPQSRVSAPDTPLGAKRRASPQACSARKAVKFYAARIEFWRDKIGQDGRALRWHLPACPRYLSKVLQRKAYGLRAYYPRWWKRHIGVVVNRLDRVLASTPLAGTGRDLEEIARRYHVSPYFIVAVAATESSIGHAACSSNRKNIWGLSSCGSGWYVPQFSSWRDAYGFFAAFVNRQWPGHSSPWSFRGYAACSDCWARKVSEWMGRLFGVPARTVYP